MWPDFNRYILPFSIHYVPTCIDVRLEDMQLLQMANTDQSDLQTENIQHNINANSPQRTVVLHKPLLVSIPEGFWGGGRVDYFFSHVKSALFHFRILTVTQWKIIK